MRRPLAPHFTAKRIEDGWREPVARIVGELVDSIAGRSEIDLLRDVASPMPLRTISAMLGTPVEDRDEVQRLAVMRMASLSSVAPDRMRLALEGSKPRTATWSRSRRTGCAVRLATSSRCSPTPSGPGPTRIPSR